MDASICPKFEQAMVLMSQRWTGMIIHQLLDGPKRFHAFETSLGISARVLSKRLKELENVGIIQRLVYPEIPVRIEYELTKKGKALKPILNQIETWATTWIK